MAQLAFPQATRLSDLFDSTGPEFETWETHDFMKRCHVRIGGCRVQGGGTLTLTPKPHVLDYIKANMIPVPNDVIFFVIVPRSDGALITVQYSKILGERWLAIVDLKSIPEA